METMTDYDLIIAFAKRFGITVLPELYGKKDRLTLIERIPGSEGLLAVEHIFSNEGKVTTRRVQVMKAGV